MFLCNSDTEELIGKKPASSMEGKCLRSCIMKKYELMDTNGKLNKAVALSHAKPYTEGAADKIKTAGEIIDACDSIEVSANPCEAAEQYGKCFKEQAVAHGVGDKFHY